MLKYYYGINQYGNRDKLINLNKVQECPRYSQEETWQHVVQCLSNLIKRKVDFIINLYIELMKKKHNTISDQSVKDIIADIREFLRGGDDFRINQGYFRM